MQPPRRRWLPWILVGAGGCLMLTVVSILGFVGCLAVIAGVGGSGNGDGEVGYAEAKKTAVPIGERTKAGKVSWTVHDAWQASELKSFGQKKRGNFIIVRLTFTNNDTEPVTLDSASLALLDYKGRTHETDTEASMYTSESRAVLEPGKPRGKQGGAGDLRRGAGRERSHTQVRRYQPLCR
jgi:Domain of unknown function (DUF4352)